MEKEDIVQAVVIMDTFNNNFYPITVSNPWALFPVVGVPVIDFLLDSLAQSGVNETILICCYHPNNLREYIRTCIENKVRWSLSMEIKFVVSETCTSIGDGLRELDAKGFIRGHFILTGVNTISNLQLISFLEKHKQTCKKDKGAAMTLLYKEVAWGHQLISPKNATILAADARTKRVLYHKKSTPENKAKTISIPLIAVSFVLSYVIEENHMTGQRSTTGTWDYFGKSLETEKTAHCNMCQKNIHIALPFLKEIMLGHSEVEVHQNLVDTNIAICSPSVLPLFADNFDFQTKDDFIKGVLMNEEFLASTLYWSTLKGGEYAASISDWQSYQTISRDIIHNWAYPLTVDSSVQKLDQKYRRFGNNIFTNKNVSLSRKCILEQDVVIGEDCTVDDNTKIKSSIIGKNCQIGKNVVIYNSFILSDVKIKDNSVIKDSFIADNCEVNQNTKIEGGCVIGPNEILKNNTEMKGQIICSSDAKKDEDSHSEWDNESVNSELERNPGYMREPEESDSDYSSDSSEDSSRPESPMQDDANSFLQEVIDSLERGYEEKLNCENLILEINSSRYAYNMQLHEVNFNVVKALLCLPMMANATNFLTTLKDVLKFFKPILLNYIKNEDSIKDCLGAIEESCEKHEWLDSRTGQIVHLLYEHDILEEDSLIEWYQELKKIGSPVVNQPALLKFIEWLQQATEESDESD